MYMRIWTNDILFLSLLLSCSCQDCFTDNCYDCPPILKRTLGQLLVSAHESAGYNICVYGQIGEVATDGENCYLLFTEPKNYCSDSYINTGVMNAIDSPFWLEKGFCSSAGVIGTSGRNIVQGSTIAVIATRETYLATVERNSASERLGIHAVTSPIFDVGINDDIVIGGKSMHYELVEELTIKSDDFFVAGRNILSGHLLRFSEFCTGEFCANACVSHSSAASGHTGTNCAEGTDCYYGAACSEIQASEPDYCESCGESPTPQPDSGPSDRWIPESGIPVG